MDPVHRRSILSEVGFFFLPRSNGNPSQPTDADRQDSIFTRSFNHLGLSIKYIVSRLCYAMHETTTNLPLAHQPKPPAQTGRRARAVHLHTQFQTVGPEYLMYWFASYASLQLQPTHPPT